MSDSVQCGAFESARFQMMPSGRIACNAIVLWHEACRDAIVIDPTDDAQPVIDFCLEHTLKVRCILLTHAHFDHTADVERAMKAFSCPALLHKDDWDLYRDMPRYAPIFGVTVAPPTMPLEPVEDGQRIELLPDYPIEVLHLPGHSAGSVGYHLPNAGWAFTGDTLFCGGIGRTDFPGGSSRQITASIRERLYALKDDTLVVPGHGPTTTIGAEKRSNPFVRA